MGKKSNEKKSQRKVNEKQDQVIILMKIMGLNEAMKHFWDSLINYKKNQDLLIIPSLKYTSSTTYIYDLSNSHYC